MPALAIVGARKATPYGLSCAHRFARRTAQAGVVVVSGGAIGCDQAAHRGALEGKGKTIVVLGCGGDVIYPARARHLFEEVLATGGLIVSEAPWGSPPSRWGFRRRNRIIAALAQATLIVEAGLPSGTFSTADATLAQGKDVWVVPGSIDSQESQGSNRLLLQGAAPIIGMESFDDMLSSIFKQSIQTQIDFGFSGVCSINMPSGPEGVILKACAARPMHAEELIEIASVELLQVVRLLSALELKRKISRLRDGRYITISRDGGCTPLS